MKVIHIKEETTCFLSTNEISEQAAHILYSEYQDKISVEFPTLINQNRYGLRSKGYVGFVQINEDYALRITPKLPIKNILKMLDYVYDLKAVDFQFGEVEVDSIEDVFEYLARVFSKLVMDRINKGIYRSYISRRLRLGMVRGRVLVRQTSLEMIKGQAKAHCEYSELTPDLEDNQLIFLVLHQLNRFPFKRKDTKRAIFRAFRELVPVISLKHFSPRDCIDRIYNRLNQDYSPIHALCRFFLENTAPTLKSHDREFIPFLVNMWLLFEQYVADTLSDKLHQKYVVDKQYRVDLDPNGRYTFQIDIVIREKNSEVAVAVLDTKYKQKPDPENSDIEQIVAYASKMRARKALLIYPTNLTRSFRLLDWSDELEVLGQVCDISGELEDGRNEFIAEVNTKLA